MIRKLNQIGVEYRKSHRQGKTNSYWGMKAVGRVGDAFEFAGTMYQDFQFADCDERFAKYNGPQLLLLKSRITEDRLHVPSFHGMQMFDHFNYAIGEGGPVSAQVAGVDLIDAKPLATVTEAVEQAKQRIEAGRVFLINYITE